MSWEQTRTIYRHKAHDVMKNGRVLIEGAPGRVPVLAEDLDYMCQELELLDQLRELMRMPRGPQ